MKKGEKGGRIGRLRQVLSLRSGLKNAFQIVRVKKANLEYTVSRDLSCLPYVTKKNTVMHLHRLIFLYKYKPSQTSLCTAKTFFDIEKRISLGDVN